MQAIFDGFYQAGVCAVFQWLGQSFVSDMEEGNEEGSQEGRILLGLPVPFQKLPSLRQTQLFLTSVKL